MRKSVQKRVKVCKSVRGGPAFGTTPSEESGKTCGVDRQNVHPAQKCNETGRSGPAFGTTAREIKGKRVGWTGKTSTRHRNAVKPCGVDRHSKPPREKPKENVLSGPEFGTA